MSDASILLEARGLRLAFDERPVLDGIDLAVARGTIVTVLGKSGAGKSVLLKCLAGLLIADEGEIRFQDRLLAPDDPVARAEFRRHCSYLFQHNALLDSLTALENVCLPLEQTTRLTRREIRARASEMLCRFELEEFRDVAPSHLSGGMQKRLALARALVTRPELVLFDEPTAGLDPVRRNAVFTMIARYQRTLGFTAVVVTHDVPEALAASDVVALLDGGRLRFQGAPAAFEAAEDPVVKSFRDSAAELRAQMQNLADETGPDLERTA